MDITDSLTDRKTIMQNNTLKVLTFSFFALCIICTRAQAMADCGTHELDTVFAAKAFAIEAIPLTPENILSKRLGALPKRNQLQGELLGSVVAVCPDDSEQTKDSPRLLGRLWATGLRTQLQIASLDIVKTGRTTEDIACVHYDIANIHYDAAAAWVDVDSRGGLVLPPASEIQGMQQLKQYSHVHKIWTQAAAKIGLALPTPATDMIAWKTKITQQFSAARAHQPDGAKNCGESASITITSRI
jgi:hypothetical protein